ncbi:MAG: amidase family protein [Pseudomonadota bacterium]
MSSYDPNEISALDAHGQAELLKSGAVGPAELVDAALERIEALNPQVNAINYIAAEHALAATKKVDPSLPMAGVPYVLKEATEYPGLPHTSGSRICKNRIGRRSYPFTDKLDAAGLIVCGLSTMPEFGLTGTGEALLNGPTRNPWDLEKSSGGSSSGAAVAVATGMTPFATGSDGGGSIRIPASHCGVVGFKPSRGWNDRARGVNLVDDILVSDGLLARSMRDTIWGAQYVRSQPPGQVDAGRRLKVALCLKGLNGADPDADVSGVVRQAAELCASLGHSVEERSLPLDASVLHEAFGVIWCYGAGEVVDFFRAKSEEDADRLLEPWTLGLAARRDAAAPNEIADAFKAVSAIDSQLASFWEDYDVVLSPTTSSTAPPLGVMAPDRPFDATWKSVFQHVNYTQLQNMAGFPGLSLPLFTAANGMPAGAMFWTRAGGDDLLLSLGAALEKANPWGERRPPLAR